MLLTTAPHVRYLYTIQGLINSAQSICDNAFNLSLLISDSYNNNKSLRPVWNVLINNASLLHDYFHDDNSLFILNSLFTLHDDRLIDADRHRLIWNKIIDKAHIILKSLI